MSFEVLSKLTQSGVAQADALAKVQAKLEAKEADAAIQALVAAKEAKKP